MKRFTFRLVLVFLFTAACIRSAVDRAMEGAIPAAPEWDMEGTVAYSGNGKIVPVWVRNYFDEVVNYVINVKSKKPEAPPPPTSLSFDYCFPCDDEKKAQYSRDTAAYVEEFTSEHREAISKGFKVIKYLEGCQAKGLPYDSTEAARIVTKMQKDTEYLIGRMAQKVAKAWHPYKSDTRRLPMLIQISGRNRRAASIPRFFCYEQFYGPEKNARSRGG